MLARVRFVANALWNNRSVSNLSWSQFDALTSTAAKLAFKTLNETLVKEFAQASGLDDAGAVSCDIRKEEHESASDRLPHITARFFNAKGQRLGHRDTSGRKRFTFHVPTDKSLWKKHDIVVGDVDPFAPNGPLPAPTT